MKRLKQTDKYRLRFKSLIILLIAGVVLSFILTMCFGAMKINPIHSYRILLEKVFGIELSGNDLIPLSEYNIIWKIRLPRVTLAAVAGAGLALCGAVMQATVQNPLAEPYILGISSVKLVLSGTVVNALFSAFSNFLITVSGDSESMVRIKFWTNVKTDLLYNRYNPTDIVKFPRKRIYITN